MEFGRVYSLEGINFSLLMIMLVFHKYCLRVFREKFKSIAVVPFGQRKLGRAQFILIKQKQVSI
jgi:hypothetical protein